ncbi:hypothetical protein PBY51_022901 [Eleginops maclovinus]|uniref:Uncharacterized protein n=1 Tax=Eleginops maclovinus TaxID=56733 RepID=A0AAN7XIS7_ELEMC|nr:hypothetical protein PBY51_022901 [Eleginops maclovinus]
MDSTKSTPEGQADRGAWVGVLQENKQGPVVCHIHLIQDTTAPGTPGCVEGQRIGLFLAAGDLTRIQTKRYPRNHEKPHG